MECQKECQNKCQQVCQIECRSSGLKEGHIEWQSLCQKECQIECQNMSAYIHIYLFIYIYIYICHLFSRWYVRIACQGGSLEVMKSIFTLNPRHVGVLWLLFSNDLANHRQGLQFGPIASKRKLGFLGFFTHCFEIIEGLRTRGFLREAMLLDPIAKAWL